MSVGWSVGWSVGRSRKRLKCAKRLILTYLFIPITLYSSPHSFSFIRSFIYSFIHSSKTFIHKFLIKRGALIGLHLALFRNTIRKATRLPIGIATRLKSTKFWWLKRVTTRVLSATEAASAAAAAKAAAESPRLLTKTSITTAACLLYTSPSPRDGLLSRMPSSA